MTQRRHDTKHHHCKLLGHSDDIVSDYIEFGIFVHVRRALKRSIMIHPRHPYTKLYASSIQKLRREEKRHLINHYYMIHPLSMFNFCFDIFMASLLFGTYLLAPVLTPSLEDMTMQKLFAFKNLMHLLLFILSFCTGYYDSKNNLVILSRRRVVLRYLRTYIISDLCGILPSVLRTLTKYKFIRNQNKLTRLLGPFMVLIMYGRYLATGMSFKQLSFQFMRGDSTIGQIVEEVCDNIWSGLQMEFKPIPSELQWIEKAERVEELWNLPNCIGSIDGKHIRIHCLAKTGSAIYNYKSYFSLQLLAIADADSNFTAIDVGDYGRNGDGAVFKNSSIGRNFQANTINFPPPQPLSKEPHEPYYFVGDAAFPLSKNLLKPYPSRNLTNPKRIFNYRLSRARRSVECAFGIMVSKFKILVRSILYSPHKVDKIVKAICVLNNFIRKMDEKMSEPTFEMGGLPHNNNNTQQILQNFHPQCQRGTNEAIILRDRLCAYVNQPYAALPWQSTYCV